MTADTHIQAAIQWIAAAESADAKRANYENAADEITAAMEEGGLGFSEVGRRIGKSDKWVAELVAWRSKPASTALATPWTRTPDDHRKRVEERKEPTRPEDRVEMATKLMADPEVAKAVITTANPARPVIQQTVTDENRQQREQGTRMADERRRQDAMPMAAHLTKIVMKAHDWIADLDGLIDDLDEIPDGFERDQVRQAMADLSRAAQRWVDRLDRKPDLRVIEGERISR